MKTSCPQCGAEIEFRFDDSFVRVCGHCRSAITRTDRGVETLGKIADLAPMSSPLSLFAEGNYGSQSFLLIGRAQVRHAAGGLWQEWYAKFSGGVWGWLAEAQGRFYMTFEVPGAQVPPAQQLTPGAQVTLPTHGGPRTFTVAELGVSTYTAAAGELPYRLTAKTSFRYADLSDGQGGFATIDYGEPDGGDGAPPSVYVGGQIRLDDLHLHGGEVAPPTSATISSKRLACPKCNGALELHAPDATLRIACPYCTTLLDVGDHSELSILAQRANPAKAKPRIPLGHKATFAEGELTVIGYMQRSARVDGAWYPFHEYLLHSPSLGFRWLVCSDGHWSYVQPVSPGACTISASAGGARYQQQAFRHFQTAPLRVDRVVGEFYWRVEVGEGAVGEDFVAPPAMLSCETSGGEINWSLSTYLSRRELVAAVGKLELEPVTGVAPNQPWPHTGVGKYYALLCVAFLAVSGLLSTARHERVVTLMAFPVPSGKPTPEGASAGPEAPPNPDGGHVFFSDPFQLDGGDNIEVTLSAPLRNNWMYVVTDLVNEASGTFVNFDTALEFYQGYEGGESWSEGSSTKSTTLSALPSGSYVLRLEAIHGGPAASPTPITLSAYVQQDVFQLGVWAVALLGMLLPGAFFFISSRSFEQRRMANSGHDEDED